MTGKPTFRQAADTVMPYGQYAGKTLDAIAFSDRGLSYLDWLRGDRQKKGRDKTPFDVALATYLDHPTIARDLQRLVRRREERLRP